MPTVAVIPIMVITMGTHMTESVFRQMRLWQMISPSLPIGAYAYSGGLEAAIEADIVTDVDTAQDWIGSILRYTMARTDIPCLQRLYNSVRDNDELAFQYWNDYLLASRESFELLQEDVHMGRALARLLPELGLECAPYIQANQDYAYAAVFALGCVLWQIDLQDASMGLLWSWSENQVAAAIKLVPLGQTQGQQLLMQLQALIPRVVDFGSSLTDAEIGYSMPGLSMLSAWHENQYSRLFRS